MRVLVQELDARARKGETVVRGGTGGYTVDSQLRLAEGTQYCIVYTVLYCVHSGSGVYRNPEGEILKVLEASVPPYCYQYGCLMAVPWEVCIHVHGCTYAQYCIVAGAVLHDAVL